MLSLGPLEIAIIAVIVLIFFGAGKLGDVGGALGRSLRDIRDAAGWNPSDKSDDKKSIDEPRA
jgi:sec-independent protein translocase protein TatA